MKVFFSRFSEEILSVSLLSYYLLKNKENSIFRYFLTPCFTVWSIATNRSVLPSFGSRDRRSGGRGDFHDDLGLPRSRPRHVSSDRSLPERRRKRFFSGSLTLRRGFSIALVHIGHVLLTEHRIAVFRMNLPSVATTSRRRRRRTAKDGCSCFSAVRRTPRANLA